MGFLENAILLKSHFLTGPLHSYNLISLSDVTTRHTEVNLPDFYLYVMPVSLHFFSFSSITPIIKKVITWLLGISLFIHAFSSPSQKYKANGQICFMKSETPVIKLLLPLMTMS